MRVVKAAACDLAWIMYLVDLKRHTRGIRQRLAFLKVCRHVQVRRSETLLRSKPALERRS